MKVVWKALAAVVRERPKGPEVLVFRHPSAGVQLPKGTVEPGETIAAPTLRELEEESGLVAQAEPEHVGVWERIVGSGPNEDGPLEINRWSVSVLSADGSLPEQWDHRAEGNPAENGLIFEFFWMPLDADFPGAVEPLFEPVARMILDHQQSESRKLFARTDFRSRQPSQALSLSSTLSKLCARHL